MPAYEQKKTSVILRNSVGSLIQAMPETEADNVLYENATVESALQDLEDADVAEGYSELETKTETTTVETEVHRRITLTSTSIPAQQLVPGSEVLTPVQSGNKLVPLFWLSFGYSYSSNESTQYTSYSIQTYDPFIENGSEWSMEIELPTSIKPDMNYQAISFGIAGSESEFDANGEETILKPYIAYGINSDENENGYAPWSEAGSTYSDFIKTAMPAEEEVKSWLCNASNSNMYDYAFESIPLADRDMTFSLTGLGSNRYRVSFIWNLNGGTVEETRQMKSFKTSIVRNDDSVTETLQPMSGLMQSIAGTINSRIILSRTYPIDSSTKLDATVLIGDSEGTIKVID